MVSISSASEPEKKNGTLLDTSTEAVNSDRSVIVDQSSLFTKVAFNIRVKWILRRHIELDQMNEHINEQGSIKT